MFSSGSLSAGFDAGQDRPARRLGRGRMAIAALLLGSVSLVVVPGQASARAATEVTALTAGYATGGTTGGGATASTAQGTATAVYATPTGVESTAMGGVAGLGRKIVAVPAATTRNLDLYDSRAERWQDPDYTACTAAASLSMLNTIAYGNAASTGFVWQPTTSYATQESILAFERQHMTMLAKSAGSDSHGWRNALNYYGWGSLTAGVYSDRSYTTLDAAAKAAVTALAVYRKPVGILAAWGGHAEFITGYKVTGTDPRTGSTNFTILGVYLTDPYKANGHRDTWTTIAQWRSGGTWVKFSKYLQTDSPYKDPIDGHVGKSEWYGKWVIIAPGK
jgi:hypothetical protein